MTVTALLGWVNERWLGISPVIGVTLGGLTVSLLLLVLGELGLWGVGAENAEGVLRRLAFDDLLLHGLLGAILFAGALDIELNELVSHRWVILVLATAGVERHAGPAPGP